MSRAGTTLMLVVHIGYRRQKCPGTGAKHDVDPSTVLLGRDVHPNVAERGGRAELNAHVLEGHAAVGHPRHGCDVEPNRQCRHAEVALIVGPGHALTLQGRPGHQEVRLSQRAPSFIQDSALDVASRLLSRNRRG